MVKVKIDADRMDADMRTAWAFSLARTYYVHDMMNTREKMYGQELPATWLQLLNDSGRIVWINADKVFIENADELTELRQLELEVKLETARFQKKQISAAKHGLLSNLRPVK